MLDLMGGDPFCNRGDLYAVLEAAGEHGLPVTVRSSGRLLQAEDYERLGRAHARLLIHFVNFIPGTDAVQTALLLQLLKAAKAADYHDLAFMLLYDEAHIGEADAAVRWLSRYAPVQNPALFFGAGGGAATGNRLRQRLNPRSASQYAVGMEEANRMLQGHPCWQDSLGIMANGDVRRCIADESRTCGNLTQSHILDIVKAMRKEEDGRAHPPLLPACEACEFSFGCFSCDVTGQKLGAGADKAAWNCGYNPGSGQFEAETAEA